MAVTLTHYPGGEVRLKVRTPIASKSRAGGVPKYVAAVRSDPAGFGRVVAAPRAELSSGWKFPLPFCPLADTSNFNGLRIVPDTLISSVQTYLKYAEQTGLLRPAKLLKPGWGLLGKPGSQLSNAGILALHRGACALEETFSRSQIIFATFTLPGRDPAAIRNFACWSGYIMNRVMVRARRHFAIDGKLNYESWWEPHKDGTLHFHACMAKPADMSEARARELLQSSWYDILCDLSDSSGVDMFKRRQGDSWRDRWEEVTKDGEPIKDKACNVAEVVMSVANYMGSYMKKEQQRRPIFAPSRWWNQTREVAAKVSKQTKTIHFDSVNQEVAELALVLSGDLMNCEDVGWCVPWKNPFTGEIIGWIARCPKQFAAQLFSALGETIQRIAAPIQAQAAEIASTRRRAENQAIKLNQEIEDEEQAWEAIARDRYGGRGWYRDERGNWRDGNLKAKWCAARGEYIDAVMAAIGEPIPELPNTLDTVTQHE